MQKVLFFVKAIASILRLGYIRRLISSTYAWLRQFCQRTVNMVSNLEKKINILGQEITSAYSWLYRLDELVKQINSNPLVYKKHCDFFDLIYLSFYNELIHAISRLYDQSRDSLSIMNLLGKNIKHNDEQSTKEKEMLDKLQAMTPLKKIKIIRNKLGRAHLDEKFSTDIEKQKKCYQENNVDLKDFRICLSELTNALELLSERLETPIWLLIKPHPSAIKKPIRQFFKGQNEYRASSTSTGYN